MHSVDHVHAGGIPLLVHVSLVWARKEFQMTENMRRRMAGCSADDRAAAALAEALDVCSGGKRFVKNRSIVGASFRPSKGGWVVHNVAWAGWGGLPHFVLRTACAVLTGTVPEDIFEERYGVIADSALRSYYAGRGETTPSS